MNDPYNIGRYLPKKYHEDIDEINMESDFDNSKNRTVHHYFVYYKDGRRLDGIGIKDVVNKIKANEM